jgi:hypothetical protein
MRQPTDAARRRFRVRQDVEEVLTQRRRSLEDQDIFVQTRSLHDADQAFSQLSVQTHEAAGVSDIAAVCELPHEFPLVLDPPGQFTRFCLRYTFLGMALALGTDFLADDPKRGQHVIPAAPTESTRL